MLGGQGRLTPIYTPNFTTTPNHTYNQIQIPYTLNNNQNLNTNKATTNLVNSNLCSVYNDPGRLKSTELYLCFAYFRPSEPLRNGL